MKTAHHTLFAICLSISLFSCTNNSKNTTLTNAADSIFVDSKIDTLNLINSKCFSCHNPNMDIDNRLAPPMFKVREHYISDSIDKIKFVNSIWKFVQNPSEELSIMPGAVSNFNLMPKQNFTEEEVKTIASYLYENDVSSDSWYKKWETLNNKQ
jgi:mono/diheme cytochrome c family protein